MTDITSLGDYVRFQLASLNVKNKHHTFEDLCHQFARLAISPNFLPATGPVSAGGDQGRDSETFDAAVSNVPQIATTWSFSDGRRAVLACSLEKKPKAKIESDVNSICKTGVKPESIYFFSNQDIPVAARHSLQTWCSNTHGVHLEILDVNALAEQLTRIELFWIAQKFLNIPSEMYPRSATGEDEKYSHQRNKWIVEKVRPVSFGDFMDVKYGIRHATFTQDAKVDIPDWIGVLRSFIGQGMPDDLARRSQYEICVAALRGQNDLTSHTSIVNEYFSKIDVLDSSQQIGDAVVLLSYCSTALVLREFSFDPNQLHIWTKKLIHLIENLLKDSPGAHTKCELLQDRAYAATLPFQRGTTPTIDWDSPFKWWDRLVREIRHAPLFALESFANLLTELVPVIGDDPRFSPLTDRVNALLEGRSRGFLAAEKCRDRAIAFVESDRPVRAIRELHGAKIKWFAEETIQGTVLSMLLLSRLYADLGLMWAAKYYALAAAFLVHKHSGDQVKCLLPKIFIQLANVCYRGGEWLNFIDLLPLVGAAQYQFRSSPDDLERHQDFESVIMHALILKAVGERFGHDGVKTYLPTVLEKWPLPDGLNDLILDPPTDTLDWVMKCEDDLVWARIHTDLNGQPFSDAGAERKYEWRALGICWEVSCENSVDTIVIVEGLVSCLQIILADMADVELNLLPTKVAIQAKVSAIGKFEIKELDCNDAMKWSINLPLQGSSEDFGSYANGLASAIVAGCSLLRDQEIMKIFESSFKNGLAGKTFVVRPYHELLREFASKEHEAIRRSCTRLDTPSLDTCLHEANALAWRTGPGPGYSKKRSLKFIKNRYSRALIPVRLTLSRLRTSEEFKSFVVELRHQGYLDWHILLLICNAAINFRLPVPTGEGEDTLARNQEATMEFMGNEETAEAIEIPESAIIGESLHMKLDFQLAIVAKTWGLQLKSRTPDFKALKRVMVERYAYFIDDVEHQPLFD
ncbi:hypothetical protein [Paraburkholderia sp. CI3]|uniref:hypothetical protein n=1 Tax=Paraburkholderia sp. CI3 TaxID=2991060 RepID=UPI003D1987F6